MGVLSRRRVNRQKILWTLLPAAVMALPQNATAQILSPGKLAAVHSELEGLRKCTSCHVLGERGISNDKCLECHEALRTRVIERRGFHADLAQRDCAECHKDHFGVDFGMVRFDTTAFDHASMGFDLVDAHRTIECEDCHQPQLIRDPRVRAIKDQHGMLDRTFLGLGTTCLSCHETDSPHDSQFSDRACDECHRQTEWTPADLFDHDQTRYRLTGSHRQVQCEECHHTGSRAAGGATERYVQYRGLDYSSCTSCHEDVHRGKMDGSCTGCHNTTGWHSLDRARFEGRFDHDATEFSLVGKHAEIECALCHDRSRAERDGIHLTFIAASRQSEYPHPVAADCLSCHPDYHSNVFERTPGGPLCESCHTQTDWLPTSYDIERHNGGVTFTLTGAHLATPCQSCHTSQNTPDQTLQFRFASSECESCHERDNPHVGQFANQQCTTCHDTESFMIESFDHTKTRYPLDGAHTDVACNDCHPVATDPAGREYRVYRPLGTECRDCHGGAA